MTEETIHRLRFSVDVPIKTKTGKPLVPALSTRALNRIAAYARVCAFEGMETKAEVVYDENLFAQHVHHHDATIGRCRPDYQAAHDGLGPLIK